MLWQMFYKLAFLLNSGLNRELKHEASLLLILGK